MSEITPRLKGTADGQCGICNRSVPEFNLNKFYCSANCREQAFRAFHPDRDGDEE